MKPIIEQVPTISARKLELLLTKNKLEEATALRGYDNFNHLIGGILGGTDTKRMLETIFHGLDEALISHPKDSKILLQNVLQIISQHITDPTTFLNSISFVRVNKGSQKGFYLKVDNKNILLDRFFSEKFVPKGVFADPKATELKLNKETVQLIMAKMKVLRSVESHEIKDIRELQAGDIVVFVRNKRSDKHNMDTGRMISGVNSVSSFFAMTMANSKHIFGHNRSSHAGIIVQGKEVGTEKNPVQYKDIQISHVVKDGFTHENLADYFEHGGGEKRTLFVFRPNNKDVAKRIVFNALSEKNTNLKWRFSAGGKALVDKTSGSKTPKPISTNTICSKFVAQCAKISLVEASQKEGRDLSIPMNTNMTPKNLEHWLILQNDLFTPHIFYGDRSHEKKVELRRASENELMNHRIKSYAKYLKSSHFLNMLEYTLAEIQLEIAQKEFHLQKIKLIKENISSSNENLEYREIQKEFLEKRINVALHDIEISKISFKIRELHNKMFFSGFKQEDKKNINNSDVDHEKKIELKTLLKMEQEFENKLKNAHESYKSAQINLKEFEKLNSSLNVKSNVIDIINDVNREKIIHEQIIAACVYSIKNIERKIEKISDEYERKKFSSLIDKLKELMDVDYRDHSKSYFQEVLQRLIVLEVSVN